MELVSLQWSFSRHSEDVHLMRGRSSSIVLIDRLSVTSKVSPTAASQDQSPADFRHDNPNAAFAFKPSFKATFNPTTNEYEGFGVRVNALTGEVNTGPNTSAHPLYNFTILASVVADRNIPASPRKRAYLRIHLHNHVAKAWLSPSRMRVPKDISGFSFSGYAQFDDQTIARLETMTATTQSGSNVIDWFSEPQDKVDNDTGFITLDGSEADGSEINVRAVLTADLLDGSGGQVEARGVVIPYTLPQIAQLIPGSAGYDRRDDVPNFIFLSEGFLLADEPKFSSMIDHFLTALRQDSKFKPFDSLAGRMNFWKVFVPSAARGIGTAYEVYGEERAYPVPRCSESFDVTNESPASEDDLIEGEWGPNQLRHYFGLPVLSHKGMSNDDIRTYWKRISFLPDGLIDEVSNGLIEEWKTLGDHRYVDQSDTFLGVQNGGPTRAKAISGEDTTEFSMNPQRSTRYRLNRFLVALQYQDETGTLQPIGPVWDIDSPPSGTGHIGKDYDNVIILLCANYGREQNEFGDLFANVIGDQRDYLGIEADPFPNAGFPAGRAVRVANLDAGRLLVDMPLIPGKTTLLHELGHSLGLGDEYGELGITKQSKFFQFTGTMDIEEDRHYSNVQAKSDLVALLSTDTIVAEQIKWRWHRIEKSGVLAAIAPPASAAITTNGFQYTLKLRPGQAAAFAEFDHVFLRRRVPGESILRDTEYAQITPRYPFVTRSPELAVISVDAAADQVVVQPMNPGELTGHDLIADFPAACVLYKPLLSRTDNPTDFGYPFLELTAANVLRFMATTFRPLHENVDGLGHPELDFEADQNPVLEGIGSPLCARKNRNIIGLYAGGKRYHHGVYHPTGHCIMRNNYKIAEFCSACKYIITDYIDPSLHPIVDALIEEYYPLKEEEPIEPPPF